MEEHWADPDFALLLSVYFVISEIKHYVRRAKSAEMRLHKRANMSTSTPPKNQYEIATAAFYLQAVSNEDRPEESWHNYALCQMLVHSDLEGAKESFLCAMDHAPRDRRIISNFDVLLRDEEYLNTNASAHEVYLEERVRNTER